MANFFLSRRFLPLFITQFLGAGNDNFLKNALLLAICCSWCPNPETAGFYCNLAAGLFILPFFLFSTLAGECADYFDKASYVRVVKFVEIILMLGAWLGWYAQSPIGLLAVLFGMGTQSAFFGPAKYALLPQHLNSDELLSGNGWIAAGTYVAILGGVILSGLVLSCPGGMKWCGPILLVVAVAGYVSSRGIPPAPPVATKVRFNWNLYQQTKIILIDAVWRQKTVRQAIISASFFWLVGSLYLTQVPLVCRQVLNGGELICTWLFVLFTLGVGLGAWVVVQLKDQPGTRHRFMMGAIIAMALLSFELGLVCQGAALPAGEKLWRHWQFYRVSLDFLLIAVAGGIWVVPLQTLMQRASRPEILSRAIAGNNIINSLAMTLGAIGAMLVLSYGNLSWLFALLGVMLLPVAGYTRNLLRELRAN